MTERSLREELFSKVPGSDAEMFIQWKGTDVCLDFHCPCQPEDEMYAFHVDGYFAYGVRCPECGAIYVLGTQVLAKRHDGFDGMILDLRREESWE